MTSNCSIAWSIEPASILSSANSYKAFGESPSPIGFRTSLSEPNGEQPLNNTTNEKTNISGLNILRYLVNNYGR